MMRTTFTIDDEAFAFLDSVAGNNRSAYINQLLKEEQRRQLEQRVLQANREEAEDVEYGEALLEWDAVLDDGLPE